MSGPEYTDVPLRIVRHEPDFTVVDWMVDNEIDAIFRRQVSYASWYYLRAGERGNVVMVKIRSDDVGLKI